MEFRQAAPCAPSPHGSVRIAAGRLTVLLPAGRHLSAYRGHIGRHTSRHHAGVLHASPLPPSCDIRGWAETNPLNGPAWSLQFEYLANILYFFVLRRLPATVIGLLAAGAAILTIDLTMNLDIFNLLGGRGLLANTVVGGWCITEQQCYIGLTRLLYPFLCGLLLSRTVRSPRIKEASCYAPSCSSQHWRGHDSAANSRAGRTASTKPAAFSCSFR